jgi:hypothetical protein
MSLRLKFEEDLILKLSSIRGRLPLEAGVQKVGTAGTAGAGQSTFGWTK